tara:strand:+ start:1414 stop:2643 length:1230 start_codon:yes stop_codon:yes gene_type:complete
MSNENSKGVIELGSVSIKCVIFQINSDNTSAILSASTTNSDGIHNGTIVSPVKASHAIRLCIAEAEKKANVQLKKINVVLEQPDFLCTKLSKNKKIDGSKIQKEDIEFLLKEGKKQITLNDERQSIIHIFNHNYIVDGKTFIEEPINVYADFLTHEMTFITAPKNNIKNIKETFINCDIQIEKYISSTFALASKLLNNSDLNQGSILIDIGYEKTSVGLFKNLALIHSLTLPIGVNHITKDISKVCSLSLNEAEIIRNKIDFSFEENNDLFDKKDILIKTFFTNSTYRKISKSLLTNIIKARLDETLEIIKKHIKLSELDPKYGNNIFITGGGSNLLNIEKYYSKYFESEAINLVKKNKNKQNDLEQNFQACLGALKIIKDGWETEAIPAPPSRERKKRSFFHKIFGNN